MIGHKGITCGDCQQILDMVVSDALDNVPIRHRYPAVFQHLLTCSDCRQSFDDLLDALRREAAGHILRAPTQRPPDPHRAAWTLSLQPAAPEVAWTRLDCAIPRAHLVEAITAPLSPAVQRGPVISRELNRLLLADVIRRPPATIALQVSLAVNLSQPDRVSLLAELSSDSALPHPLLAQLSWGPVDRSVPVCASGRVAFDGLPAVGDLTSIADLALAFEQIPGE